MSRQQGLIQGISQYKLNSAIDKIGHDIINNVISPIVGIDKVFADLYLASPGTYLIGDNEEEDLKLFEEYKKRVIARYGLKEGDLTCFTSKDVMVLYAVRVLENANPEIVEKALSNNGEN